MMPYLAPTPCARCHLLTNCTCRAKRHRDIDANRPTAKERGYDVAHRKLRILCFQRDNWKCIDCGWEPDIVRGCREAGLDSPPTDLILRELASRRVANQQHLHGDHQIPIRRDPDLRLALDNYATRCNICHSAKTMRELNQSIG